MEPFRALFPARAGCEVRVHHFRDAAERQISVHYEDVWRVRGRQRIEVPAGSFEAIAFERETLSLGSSSGRLRRLARFWLEPETGAPLRLE